MFRRIVNESSWTVVMVIIGTGTTAPSINATFIMICSAQKYCSIIWLMQSATPARVCITGSVKV